MQRKPQNSKRKISPKGKPLSQRLVRTRQLRKRFLIVFEGKKTEPNYFSSFRVNAEVKVHGIGKSPEGIVEYARKMSQSGDFDRVWVVFDRDDVEAHEFNQAIEQARTVGFGAAYSNQAFELWYLLHFGYYHTSMTRRQYQEKLGAVLGQPYDKGSSDLYLVLLPRQRTAIANAKKLLDSYQPHHNPAQDDPCTAVYLLVEELNEQLI